MPQKRKTKSKSIVNSKYKKLKIKNKNVVNVHIHRAKSAPRRTLDTTKHRTTSHSVVLDHFQPRLPITHPYANAPITAQNSIPLQNPVNVYFNSNPLNNNTPATSALHTHIQSSTPTGAQTPNFGVSPIPMNPLATPASTTPLRPSPKRPELAKPVYSNPYEVLSEPDEEDDAEISRLSSELN